MTAASAKHVGREMDNNPKTKAGCACCMDIVQQMTKWMVPVYCLNVNVCVMSSLWIYICTFRMPRNNMWRIISIDTRGHSRPIKKISHQFNQQPSQQCDSASSGPMYCIHTHSFSPIYFVHWSMSYIHQNRTNHFHATTTDRCILSTFKLCATSCRFLGRKNRKQEFTTAKKKREIFVHFWFFFNDVQQLHGECIFRLHNVVNVMTTYRKFFAKNDDCVHKHMMKWNRDEACGTERERVKKGWWVGECDALCKRNDEMPCEGNIDERNVMSIMVIELCSHCFFINDIEMIIRPIGFIRYLSFEQKFTT